MKILAIDPGTTHSAMLWLADGQIEASDYICNDDALQTVAESTADLICCEMVASYGMPVGREVFETVLWTGRFWQASPVRFALAYRKDIKLHLCNSPRANDSNIRQALIDRLGAPGTKKNPGATYGISSHAWAALAVAIYAHDTLAK